MAVFLFFLFLIAGLAFLYLFLAKQPRFNSLWLMLSAWMLALGVPRLHLSRLELVWPSAFWWLVIVSLVSFSLGTWSAAWFFKKYPFWNYWQLLRKDDVNTKTLRIVIYVLVALSLVALKMFYDRAGNFPLLAMDPDAFRFAADDKVPGLINYTAQLARLFIPLSFFLMFTQGFSWKKHWDQIVLCLVGTAFLILFASRTQVFMIDLLVMALYLFIRRPSLKQAVKFYPIFLLISVVVLAAIPLIRQARSYGPDYLSSVTGIDTSHFFKGAKYLVPIYVGISFNMQALLHAQNYYLVHPLQHGKVTLDPFTNILGLHQFKSHYDLGQIFESWWNTGTYLFPFVQDFGTKAFYFIPFIIALFLTMTWRYFLDRPKNFLAVSYFAYTCFFIAMTIYLSFTVRAEMYIDIFLLFVVYFIVSRKESNA